MLYDQQLGVLLLLARIMEHFAAAALSLDHHPAIDAVRMVVPTCIAAVADVVMRQVATDIPSEVCMHLGGVGGDAGYSLGSGALARQVKYAVCSMKV